MTFYAPNNKEDLEKLKNLIEQKKDIKNYVLNRKIEKETLNKDLAEIYAPITKNQEKQTEIIKEGQENQLRSYSRSNRSDKSYNIITIYISY